MTLVKFNADALHAIRERSGFTVAELSRRTGIDRALLSKYEHGHRDGNANHIRLVAEALGVPPTAIAIYTTAVA